MLAPHRKKGKAPPRTSLETNRVSTEENADDEPPILVLPSSTELFYLYGQSLEQCAKLSTGQALFDLCKLHKKWLRIYAGMSYLTFLIFLLTRPFSFSRGCLVIKQSKTTVSCFRYFIGDRLMIFFCMKVLVRVGQRNRDLIWTKSSALVWSLIPRTTAKLQLLR